MKETSSQKGKLKMIEYGTKVTGGATQIKVAQLIPERPVFNTAE